MNQTLQEVAVGIVTDENCVLLVERTQPDNGTDGESLTWVFPGGKIEAEETPEIAVVREIEEESGYKVEVAEIIHEKAHEIFPVYIYYIACTLVSRSVESELHDTAVKTSKFIDIDKIGRFITSSLDEHVAVYLGIGD